MIDRLDDSQKRQLSENLSKAQRDLRECVWRTYKHLVLLGRTTRCPGRISGLVHSSAANDLLTLHAQPARARRRCRTGGQPEPF